ncbi:hypothetical protein AC579_5182 [Pseudocercospora musae]|uniref:Uncharacterized protein n=1 Tax=Pseudocercospora musae TaxID=113226 RepID=A0A139GUT8_9PEZI|nr:hypothetical protein AC579_5182 [Pseudocercospora musae]
MPTKAPILALIPPNPSSQNLKPNLLPARIHHDGRIPISSRHWNPSESESESTFRGRNLLSQTLRLPENYTGLVLRKTLGTEREGEEAELKKLKAIGKFDEIVVWGHEVQPDRTEDVYVRGVEEWIGMAESIHAYEKGETT